MKIFCVNLPRGLRGWTSLFYKVVLIAAILPVLDGLQAIGRGNSDMLPGLATLAFGLVGVLAGIAGYIAVREEDKPRHKKNACRLYVRPGSADTTNRWTARPTIPENTAYNAQQKRRPRWTRLQRPETAV